MTATLRPLTFSDLLQMPDDLHRYEILDGQVIASPALPAGHHRVHGALLRIRLPGPTRGKEEEVRRAMRATESRLRR